MKKIVPANQLLIFTFVIFFSSFASFCFLSLTHTLFPTRATDGWEPLCKFLDKPVPDTPFPHVNDTVEFQGHLRVMYRFAIANLFGYGAIAGLSLSLF